MLPSLKTTVVTELTPRCRPLLDPKREGVAQVEKGTILVIDDDKLIRWSFQQRLSSEGYKVVTAASGEEGLTKLAGQRVDLVLLDVRLPGRSGLDVFGEIKNLDVELPVIFVTAYPSEESAAKAVKGGAYDYLAKPVDVTNLVSRVESALEARRPTNEIRQTEGSSATWSQGATSP